MSNFARMLFANHLPVDGSCRPGRWPAFCRLFLLEMLAVRFGESATLLSLVSRRLVLQQVAQV